MDASPNDHDREPRGSCAAPIVAPGLDLLVRHVAADLLNAIRSPQPVDRS